MKEPRPLNGIERIITFNKIVRKLLILLLGIDKELLIRRSLCMKSGQLFFVLDIDC